MHNSLSLIKYNKSFLNFTLIGHIFLFLIKSPVSAQVVPTDLTEKQQEKLTQSVLDYIKEMRIEEPQHQPYSVKKFNKNYTEYCCQRAQDEINKHGQWFFCEGDNGYYDEATTYRLYWQMIHYFGGLENIPGYSPENHKKAIRFWQSWQQENGLFNNPINPGKRINYKYIPAVIELLGSNPLYKNTGYGEVELDIGFFLNKCDSNQLNHGMARGSVMFTKIHEGQVKYIPTLERGIELALTHMSPHTGMFHEPNGNPLGNTWSEYHTTADAMKGFARMLGYMGIENMPYRHIRADILIKNQKFFQKADVSIIRNTAEMYMQCLFESPYRQEELLQAMAENADALASEGKWKTYMEGDYITYGLMLCGPYLHWEGYDTPRTLFYQGVAHDWRIVIGPFGRCANVVKKEPEELFWNEGWSYQKYGLRTRNEEYERRIIKDVVPASSKEWNQSKDAEDRTVLTRKFSIEETDIENPYVKIKWDGGDIEIFINGIFVHKKLGNLPDYGAVYINPEAKRSLVPGENILKIRAVSKEENPLEVSAGIIDWKLP